MALQLDITTPISATMPVQYWRIGRIEILPKAAATIEMHGYWSQGERDAGGVPVSIRAIILPIAPDAGAVPDRATPYIAAADINALIEATYAAVKSHPDFAAGLDLLA